MDSNTMLQDPSHFLGPNLGPHSSYVGGMNARSTLVPPTNSTGGRMMQRQSEGSPESGSLPSNRILYNYPTFYNNTYNYVRPDTPPMRAKRNTGAEASSTKELESSLILKRSNTIYETQLMSKGRGFPLWIPQPNMRLPPSHRAKGVSIGDVGIITEYGAFDFLFNICIPPDDPINPPDLPKGFMTLNLKPWDVREFKDFPNGSYLASSSIRKAAKGAHRRLVTTFESSANESALLAMPEGAYHEEVNDLSKFRDYAERHVESWYDYVLHERGRKDTANGDIRLVVGVDKSTSWGIASFADPFKLQLKETGGAKAKTDPPYTWEHTGMSSGEVKAGPDSCDNQDIYPASGGKVRNQTLFVRTFNILLEKNTWDAVKKPKDVSDREVRVPSLDSHHYPSSKVPTSSNAKSHDDKVLAQIPKPMFRGFSRDTDHGYARRMLSDLRRTSISNQVRFAYTNAYHEPVPPRAPNLPDNTGPKHTPRSHPQYHQLLPQHLAQNVRMRASINLPDGSQSSPVAQSSHGASEYPAGYTYSNFCLASRTHPITRSLCGHASTGPSYILAMGSPKVERVTHPSLAINSWILGMEGLPTSVKMVITHDSVWCRVLMHGPLTRAYNYQIRSANHNQLKSEESDSLQHLYDICVSPHRMVTYLESKERRFIDMGQRLHDVSLVQRIISDLCRDKRNAYTYPFGPSRSWWSDNFGAPHRQLRISEIRAGLSEASANRPTTFYQLQPLDFHPACPVTLDVLLQILNGEMSSSEACDTNTVEAHRYKLRAAGDNKSWAHAALRNLANALLYRARVLSDKDDVEEAICYYRYLESITPPNSYRYLEVVQGLCTGYYFRLQLLHMREDVDTLIKYLDVQSNLNYGAIWRSFQHRVITGPFQELLNFW